MTVLEQLNIFDHAEGVKVTASDIPAEVVGSIPTLRLGDDGQLFDLGTPAMDGEWELRDVTHETANAWLARYHYLGSAPASATFRIAAFAPEMLGVVIYARPTNAHGIAAKYSIDAWPGNVEIARVAIHPECPPNTTSRLVAATNEHVAHVAGVEWVFSYADTGQGHHGGIYQALNAVYVGISETRPGYLLDGEPIHPRSVVAWLGTQAREEAPRLAKLAGRELVWVDALNTAKHTYILPIGSPATRSAIRRALRPYVKPYPKRALSEGAGPLSAEGATPSESAPDFDPEPSFVAV